MLHTITNIAVVFGADPISLIIIFVLALVCTLIVHFAQPASLLTLMALPLLLAGGVLAYWIGLKCGAIETISVHLGEEGEYKFDWQLASAVLPNVVVLATAGICTTMVLTITAVRRLQRYV